MALQEQASTSNIVTAAIDANEDEEAAVVSITKLEVKGFPNSQSLF